MHYLSHYSASKYAEYRLSELHRAAEQRRLVALATGSDQRDARRRWRPFILRFSFRPLRAGYQRHFLARLRRREMVGDANPC